MSPAVCRSRPVAAVSMWRSGCCSVLAANASRCSQRRPGGFGGESGDVVVGLVEICDGRGPRSCSAATWKRR